MSDKQTVKFGDICREVKLTTKDPIADGYERYIGLEHLDSGSLKIKRWGMIAEDNPSFTRVFKKGNILFGKRRPYLKKAAVAEFDGICSGDIIVLESKSNHIIPKLLPHIINSDDFWSWAIQTSSGSLSPRTKYKDLALFELELDSIQQQENKLRVISSITSVADKLDQLGDSRNTLRKTLEILFKPVSSFTFDSNEGADGWEVKTLGEVAKLVPGYAFKSRDFVDKGAPLIRIGNLYQNSLDMDRKPVYLPEEYLQINSKYVVYKGDILLSMTGTAGKEDYGFVVKSHVNGALLNQRVCKITPLNIESDYLFYYLKSRLLLDQLYSLPGGTKQANISVSQLESLKVILPPLDYQRRVSQLWLELDKISSLMKHRKDDIDNIYRAVVH